MVIVQEHKSDSYAPRTYFNATSGEVTLALAVDMNTLGEKLTKKAAGDKYIGFTLTADSDPIEIARGLYRFMKQKNAKTLNIAGNGIYTFSDHGYTQEHINAFFCDVIEKVHQYWPIEKIFTGGQTGADLAGAVVADYLGIEALITLPKGYKQRFEGKNDITQTKESVEEQITKGSSLLREQDCKNESKRPKP